MAKGITAASKMLLAKRKESGKTRGGFALSLGVYPGQVANWEEGVGVPNLKNALMLEGTLGIPQRAWFEIVTVKAASKGA